MQCYLLSIYQPDGDPPPAAVMEPIMANIRAVNREMRDSGVWVFGAGLHPSSTATVLRTQDGAQSSITDGEVLMTDGPFIEGKEHIGGFTVIQAPDLDAALEWGRKVARAITLPIEVRPVIDEAERGCADSSG